MFLDPQKIVQQIGLVPEMQIVDIGSGIGTFAMAMSPYIGNTGTIYAFDILPHVITRLTNDIAERGITNITPLVGDIEHNNGIILESGIIDMVFCANVFFQISDKQTVVREISRILKPNGKLVVIDWIDSFSGMGPHRDAVISPEMITDLVTASGFILVSDLGNTGDHHFGKIFQKLM